MTPQTEAEVAQAIKSASGPLTLRGGGTRSLPTDGPTLCLAGLNGIELYEPGALTIVLKSGTPVADVEAALAAENQRLPFEPMDHRALLGTEGTPTIGGVIAANVSGPRRVQVGAARDFLLGVRFVDGRGSIVKNGGRVMKNVTGYDLVKLLAGSFGRLGALTEVSLKVLPVTPLKATVAISGLAPKDAVAALSRALGSPFEVSGAAHTPEGPSGAPETLLRVEGFEAQVTHRTEALRALLSDFGPVSVETDAGRVEDTWCGVRDVAAFHATDGDVWRISVKPSDGPAVAERLKGARFLFDWGGGLVWVEVPAGRDVRPEIAGIAGHATLVRAAAETHARLGTFHPEEPALANLTDRIRQQFDPRGLFSPAPAPAAA